MSPEEYQLIGRSASENGGFRIQGQVDFANIGEMTYKASVNFLQRLANAGIQPATHAGGLLIASHFRPGLEGRRHIEEALRDLPRVPLFHAIAEVGFGLRSFIRILADTEVGVNIAALCGCLASILPEPVCAEILGAIWDEKEFPPGLKTITFPIHAADNKLCRCRPHHQVQ
jgi:hypothetical protein